MSFEHPHRMPDVSQAHQHPDERDGAVYVVDAGVAVAGNYRIGDDSDISLRVGWNQTLQSLYGMLERGGFRHGRHHEMTAVRADNDQGATASITGGRFAGRVKICSMSTLKSTSGMLIPSSAVATAVLATRGCDCAGVGILGWDTPLAST